MDLAFFRGRKYTKYWLTFWSLFFLIAFFSFVKIENFVNIANIEVNKNFQTIDGKTRTLDIKTLESNGKSFFNLRFFRSSLYKIAILPKNENNKKLSFRIYKNDEILKEGKLAFKGEDFKLFLFTNSQQECPLIY